MAAMMLMLKILIMACALLNLLELTSLQTPLISQLFSPRIFKAAPFFTAWLFLCGYLYAASI